MVIRVFGWLHKYPLYLEYSSFSIVIYLAVPIFVQFLSRNHLSFKYLPIKQNLKRNSEVAKHNRLEIKISRDYFPISLGILIPERLFLRVRVSK